MSDNIYKATVRYAGDEFFIGTTTSGHAQTIDAKGDRKSAPTPMEMLLVAVTACTAVDVVSILEKKRQIVTEYNVEITGERRGRHPRAFTKFHFTISCRDTTFPSKPLPNPSNFPTPNIAASPPPFARRRRYGRAIKLLKLKIKKELMNKLL